MNNELIHSFFFIFTGASLLATVILFARQPLLVAYIVLGGLIGPYGLKLVTDTHLLSDIAEIGIMFLLFLLGLDMQPDHLANLLKKTAFVGVVSSVLFALLGYFTALLCGFSIMASAIIGASLMFSSTIIGIKLLPTTVLHHRHTGELVVSLLLLQDLVAIIVLLVLYSMGKKTHVGYSIIQATLTLPLLSVMAFFFVKYLLLPTMRYFDRLHEYLFLVAVGWCLGLAEIAHVVGLSAEIGAFIAGISIATSPISQYIAECLKPIRDFFLILFFFSIGARFDLNLIGHILWPALLLTLLILTVKPIVFRAFLALTQEQKNISWEVGFRLGQTSEFSILIAYIATASHLIDTVVSHVIQATVILTYLVSTYIVIFNFPNPIALSERLRRN